MELLFVGHKESVSIVDILCTISREEHNEFHVYTNGMHTIHMTLLVMYTIGRTWSIQGYNVIVGKAVLGYIITMVWTDDY